MKYSAVSQAFHWTTVVLVLVLLLTGLVGDVDADEPGNTTSARAFLGGSTRGARLRNSVIAGLHALAALKHHFINRDDVLRSMLPGRRDDKQMRAGESAPRL